MALKVSPTRRPRQLRPLPRLRQPQHRPGKKFGFRGYLWGVRVEAVNVLNRQNPDTVVNNIDAPSCTSTLTQACFGAFSGGQGLAFTLRVRFIGRK